MKYYKHTVTGDVYAYESEKERDTWGPPELVEMTDQEIQEHLNPQPTEEQLAAEIRRKRDRLLTESDWVVVKAYESGTPVPEPWVEYREKLRQITSQPHFPRYVEWPTSPTE